MVNYESLENMNKRIKQENIKAAEQVAVADLETIVADKKAAIVVPDPPVIP